MQRAGSTLQASAWCNAIKTSFTPSAPSMYAVTPLHVRPARPAIRASNSDQPILPPDQSTMVNAKLPSSFGDAGNVRHASHTPLPGRRYGARARRGCCHPSPQVLYALFGVVEYVAVRGTQATEQAIPSLIVMKILPKLPSLYTLAVKVFNYWFLWRGSKSPLRHAAC